MFHFLRSASIASILAALLVASAAAADNAEFNYEGRMLVNGLPFSGIATVKLAIVNTSGTITLWSNDGSSSNGSEPATGLAVPAANGVFDIMAGDTSLGMQPIKAILFNDRKDLRLRVWLNDGVHGSQQLTPDRRIPNIELLGLRHATEACTIYVDASDGNDLDTGLSLSHPKKTIQAAVDMVPERLSANVTIQVAAGIYRESVYLTNITAEGSAEFIVHGDEYSGPSETTIPAVRITGTDNDATHVAVRTWGINAKNVRSLQLVGILVDYTAGRGMWFENCSGVLDRLRVEHCSDGMEISMNTHFQMTNTWMVNNDGGFDVRFDSSVVMNGNCGAEFCTGRGMFLDIHGVVGLTVSGKFNNCGTAIEAYRNSNIYFVSGYSGQISNNTVGLSLHEGSIANNAAALNSFVGNGSDIVTATGGVSY